MGSRKRYKYNEIGPCATWGEKVSSRRFLSDFTDLDPRMGEIRQVLHYFPISAFWIENLRNSRNLEILKHIVGILTFP